MAATRSDVEIRTLFANFLRERYPQSLWEPDTWQPFIVREPSETPAKLAAVAGEKYSYRELDQFTETMDSLGVEAPASACSWAAPAA